MENLIMHCVVNTIRGHVEKLEFLHSFENGRELMNHIHGILKTKNM